MGTKYYQPQVDSKNRLGDYTKGSTPILGMEILSPPSTGGPNGIGWETVFPIDAVYYRTRFGKYGCDFDMQAHRPAAGATYYASPSGTGVGTKADPGALATQYSKSDMGTLRLVKDPGSGSVTAGEFYVDQLISAAKIKKSLNIIMDPQVALTQFLKPSTVVWTSTGGGIYQTTKSLIQLVCDTDPSTNNRPLGGPYNIYRQMDHAGTPGVGTNADLTGAGQWATDGTTVWVWPTNAKNFVTDGSLIRLSQQGTFGGIQIGQDAITVYVEGGALYGCGWSIAGQIIGAVDFDGTFPNSLLLMSGTKIRYSPTVAFRPKGGMSVIENVEASYNIGDGLGYETGHFGLEINCRSHHNGVALGFQGVRTNTNGSTSHNGSRIIRVNTRADNCWGPNFADVSGSRSWNMGCEGKTGLVDPAVAQSQNCGFQIQGSGGVTPSWGWFDGPVSEGNYYAYNVGDNCGIYVRNAQPGQNSYDSLTPALGVLGTY